MDQVQNMELSKDQIIQELIALLNQNQQKEAANDVFEMATLIDGMGKRLEQVAEAKVKGKAALHKVSEFLGIKDKLESVRKNVHKSIPETEHTINKLDAFGRGKRETGQKIANTFRTFADKETVDYSEKEKKFSKTELVKKPFEAKKKLYQRMEQHLDEALDKVNNLAKETERMKDVEMAEPFMLGAVAEPEFQYGAEAFEACQGMLKYEKMIVIDGKEATVLNKSR